ncbi:hypothetical protein Nmel_002324 [Mimus melanotis]
MHVMLWEFLSQTRQQKKMEEYHAKTAKAGNSKGVAPSVTDCWYYLSRVTCWDSAEGWPGDHGNPFGLMQVETNANQTKANADHTVSSQNQGRTPVHISASKQYRGISAYNAGVNTVQPYDKMVVGKTHNYVNDVDVRARFNKRNGY